MFVEVALPTPLRKNFDYVWPSHFPGEPLLGQRILVPWGKRELVGVICEIKSTTEIPETRLKSVKRLLDEPFVFPHDVLSLCKWASHYYHYPLGEILMQALPPALRKPRKSSVVVPPFEKACPELVEAGGVVGIFKGNNEQLPKVLTSHQAEAIGEILKAISTFQTFLLEGVTGSGKTEVYSRVISEVLAHEQQALVLVPEIGLTPQLLRYFESRFSFPIRCIHSGLKPKERFGAWLSAKTGNAKIILGTRSALFTPFVNLGLIVVDEEHDLSYKQQDSFRYSARDLAVVRGQLEGIPVVLGTATPSLETIRQVERGHYKRLPLPTRINQSKPPPIELIDMRAEDQDTALSKRLINLTTDVLARGEQVLFLLNRRGFAPLLMCHRCGFLVDCKNCDAHLVLHVHPRHHLRCHHCDASFPLPPQCSACGGEKLLPLGSGTARLEQTLRELFSYPVIRVDKDATQKKGTLQNLLNKIANEEPAILVGTQMLAKGHHFPNVTLVSVLDADKSLFSLDFRSTERLGQLLTQVAGRAGRGEKPGRVLIQTYHPQHPLLKQLVFEGHSALVQTFLKERKAAHLPPFSRLALLRAESKKEGLALDFLQNLKKSIEKPKEITIWGPVPTGMEKKKGVFRAQMLFQAEHRSFLHAYLNGVITKLETLKKSCRWWVEVDPQEIY